MAAFLANARALKSLLAVAAALAAAARWRWRQACRSVASPACILSLSYSVAGLVDKSAYVVPSPTLSSSPTLSHSHCTHPRRKSKEKKEEGRAGGEESKGTRWRTVWHLYLRGLHITRGRA